MSHQSSPGEPHCLDLPQSSATEEISRQRSGNLGEDKRVDNFLLKKNLLEIFKDVGAIHKCYTGAEVRKFFQKYIFGRKLIDPTNDLIVLCDENLKKALNIDKINFYECWNLLKKHLIPCEVPSNVMTPVVAGSSQSISTGTSSHQSCNTISSPLNFKFLPVVPEPISDAESNYNYQGFDTVSCHDSCDYSDDDEEEEEEQLIENTTHEFEPMTDLEEQPGVESDSDGAESIILEIWDPCETSCSDEDFFADESDTLTEVESAGEDDHSTEDEKNLWPCDGCGIKNKPFMRYCLKCWQIRKDWIPDRPKKNRKPKARAKKHHRRSSSSLQVISPTFIRSDSLTSSSTHVSSSASSHTSSSTSSASYSSSQESGFGSQATSEFQFQEDTSSEKSGGHRKRKSSVSLDELPAKYSRLTELDVKLSNKFRKFAGTRVGRKWIMESGLPKQLVNFSSDSDSDNQMETANLCTICYTRPVSASIIHGRLSHIAFCYPCAKKLHNSKKRCPICRRKIHMVTKNSFA